MGEYQNGVMYDEARQKCGGHDELTEAVANGRVIRAGTGNNAIYFFKSVKISVEQLFETIETTKSSSTVTDNFVKEYGCVVNENHDQASRFTRLPDASAVSPDSLMLALQNPQDVSSITIEDITDQIQSGASTGSVQCGVALDEPLERLAAQIKKLQRMVVIAEQNRNKQKEHACGEMLIPHLVPFKC